LIKNADLTDKTQRDKIAKKIADAWASEYSSSGKATPTQKANYLKGYSELILEAYNIRGELV
jgi:hypothetical protein